MALTETDSQLLKQCLIRAPHAWQDFVDRFVGLFVHVIQHTAQARDIRLTPDDLEDLCSDVFCAVLANDMAALRDFRSQSSLATYLSVIARRVVVRQLILKRKSEAMGHIQAHHVGSPSVPNTFAPLADDESSSLLQHLPPREASAMRMYHLEGKTYGQIGQTLGIEENSVGPLLTRARAALRNLRATTPV